MAKKLVLCDCLGSQSFDANAISKASGLPFSRVYSNLCVSQINDAASEISSGDSIVACQQERRIFEELAEELNVEVSGFVDLRDRAGWGEGNTAPKMAALAAEAAVSMEVGKSVDVLSEGSILIFGGDEALKAADTLCDTLAVTVLLNSGDELPLDRRFDCVVGQLHQVSGALGGFSIRIKDFQLPNYGGRGEMTLGEPQSMAVSECDIVLDLSGQPARVPSPEKREGYLRADPTHQPSVAKAILEASQLVGTFEKPLYVRLEENLCAHSRAEKPACSNCLNVCPTGAITSAGEHVAIDPMICAGCGSCSSVCPSGAITYDAPPVDTVFKRLTTLASTYRKAGGADAHLLVHDANHGRELISLAARFGRGLPADVIPFEMEALASFGHAEALGALASGFAHVDILLSPSTEREVIESQCRLACAIAGEGSVEVFDTSDPDTLSAHLYDAQIDPVTCEPVLPLGNRRQVARLSAKTIQPDAEILGLPEGAPYGATIVDTDACTLCLACASLCPSGALGDNADLPQLRFQEDACLQCGLCVSVCPENAITLQPQLNLTDEALVQRVMHEEEPFACIECGSLFGVKSTVERITEKLAGSHSMFSTSQAAKLIQMCDNCRIQAQYHSEDNPFQSGERPRVRTTADYFSKRKDH
ncbi:MAG: 4Fe-4S binding protein [Boseongicola sp.]|nr:4Fe-4S binding protein [Boseongicola sp.]